MAAEYLDRNTSLNEYEKKIADRLGYTLQHSNGRKTNLYWLLYTEEGKRFSRLQCDDNRRS